MSRIVCFLIFFIPFMCNATEFKKAYFEGLPMFLIDKSLDVCSSYSFFDFKMLQLTYGMKIANSALHCKFRNEANKTTVSALLAVAPDTKCGLHIQEKGSLIDPCNMREYNDSGVCISVNCDTNLIQLYIGNTENELRFLLDTELIEFTDNMFAPAMTVEEQLYLAMNVNAQKRIELIINKANFDVNYSSKDNTSLVALAIETRNSLVLKVLLENDVALCKNCDETKALLLQTLRSGNLEIPRLLIEAGVSSNGLCAKLEIFVDAKELLGCSEQ